MALIVEFPASTEYYFSYLAQSFRLRHKPGMEVGYEGGRMALQKRPPQALETEPFRTTTHCGFQLRKMKTCSDFSGLIIWGKSDGDRVNQSHGNGA
jgi:hypothetical protein